MCYSVYLTHGTVLAVIGTVWSKVAPASVPLPARQLLMISICAAAVFAAGTLYFVLIERPCMDPRWPGKLWSRLVGISRSARSLLGRTEKSAAARQGL